jgi:hypothetical protein
MRLFEENRIRGIWDEKAEKWWISVVDIVGILTEQDTTRGTTFYLGTLKKRLSA